jgi:hypothetical protein
MARKKSLTKSSICVPVTFINETAAPSLADRSTLTLEGVRADLAAARRKKGPAAAILGLLECLLALLADFKAGKLAALVAQGGATCAARPAYAARPARTASAEAAVAGKPAAAALRPAHADRRGDREPWRPPAASSAERSEDIGAGRRASEDRPPRSPRALREMERVAKPIDVTKLSLVAYGNLVSCSATRIPGASARRIRSAAAGRAGTRISVRGRRRKSWLEPGQTSRVQVVTD